LRGHILLTHTHWDHIQGLPFFMPLFESGNEWDIYAPKGLGQNLEETLAAQMQYTYFPVTLAQSGGTIRCHDLVEGTFEAGGVAVTAQYLNHAALCLGYRLEADGVTVVYATDHEPHARLQADAPPGSLPVHGSIWLVCGGEVVAQVAEDAGVARPIVELFGKSLGDAHVIMNATELTHRHQRAAELKADVD